jgi:hypothetical protein
MYKNPAGNLILNGKILKTRTQASPFSIFLFNAVFEIIARTVRK